MKKFVFRLEPLVKVKKTLEKQQKAELSEAQSAQRELEHQRDGLILRRETVRREFRAELESGISGVMLAYYSGFFDDNRKSIQKKSQEISYAELRVGECQRELIKTMRELKTYKKLKDAQYADYLKALQGEVDKELDDLISYKAAAPS